MYPRECYFCRDFEKITNFIDQYPFAILIESSNLTWLPVLLNGKKELYGHIDNDNPFLRSLDGKNLKLIFQGPNAYISPSDYVSKQLPTWNYSVVSLEAFGDLITDHDEKLHRMKKMVDHLEKYNKQPFSIENPNESIHSLIRKITFFKLEIKNAMGIFKYSQEKQADDKNLARKNLLSKIHHRDSKWMETI